MNDVATGRPLPFRQFVFRAQSNGPVRLVTASCSGFDGSDGLHQELDVHGRSPCRPATGGPMTSRR
jgi:hypothetical protein